jgi:hypothetical protein
MDALLPRLLPQDTETDTKTGPDFAATLRPKMNAMRLAMDDANALNLGAVNNAMDVVRMLEARLLSRKRAVSAQVCLRPWLTEPVLATRVLLILSGISFSCHRVML